MSGDEARTAAQRVLAAEHAAVYAYGVCGGVLEPGSPAWVGTRDAYLAHRSRRERLEQELRGEGIDPVPALTGYELPRPVDDAASAAQLSRGVEDRCAAAYAGLVRATTGSSRQRAVDWLGDAATRALGWGAQASAFPGLTER